MKFRQNIPEIMTNQSVEETDHRRLTFCVQSLQAFKFADQNLPGSGTFDLSVSPS